MNRTPRPEALKRFSGSSGSGIDLTSKPSPSSSIVNRASSSKLGYYANEFFRVELIAVLDGVHKRLIERDEKIGLLRPQTPSFSTLDQVIEDRMHRRDRARQLEFDHSREAACKKLGIIDKPDLVIKNGLDEMTSALPRQILAAKIGGA